MADVDRQCPCQVGKWLGLELQVCRFAKLNPKLSEPGEQGERAEAGRRGSSEASVRRATELQSRGLRGMPGRPLANNPSGRPRMRYPKPLGGLQSTLKSFFSDALLRPPEAPL